MTFFLLVFGLSIPFVLLGELSGARLPANLPVSALQFVVPLVAAVILVYRTDKGEGVRRLLWRVVDYSRIRRRVWYVPVFLVMPVVALLSYWLMLGTGRPVPEPNISVLAVLSYCAVYLIAGACEEVGWTGYATDPLQARWGALGAGVIIGAVWALWHVVPYLQVHGPAWVCWQSLVTVAARVIIVWLYNNTGRSVFAAAVAHATINVSYSLFPNGGTSYDPAFVGPVTVFAAVLVTFLWGSSTLSRYRYPVTRDTRW